jgi:peptide/nickel transport system ATP-binding protein
LLLRDVTLKYQSVIVLDRINLDLTAGRTLAVVGPSGSGKSTLARVAAGLRTPDAGRVERRGRAAMVFQDAYGSLDPLWTAGRIIAEPLPRALDAAAVRARVERLLQVVGLPAEAAAVRPARFSGGQRQRIAVARALAALEPGGPAVLICDEPTSALDGRTRDGVLELLVAAQARLGFAMLLASHDSETVAALAHQVRRLERGRMLPPERA